MVSFANKFERHLNKTLPSADGFVIAQQSRYLCRDLKSHITQTAQKMLENGELQHVIPGKQIYYALSNVIDFIKQFVISHQVNVLSTF